MKLKQCIEWLNKAKTATNMERASFRNICAPPKTPVTHADGRPVTEGTVDEFIRERTRIYRDTWIIGPIDDVLEDLQKASRFIAVPTGAGKAGYGAR